MTSSSFRTARYASLRIDTTTSCVESRKGVVSQRSRLTVSTQQKPEVIFFGESISSEVRDRS